MTNDEIYALMDKTRDLIYRKENEKAEKIIEKLYSLLNPNRDDDSYNMNYLIEVTYTYYCMHKNSGNSEMHSKYLSLLDEVENKYSSYAKESIKFNRYKGLVLKALGRDYSSYMQRSLHLSDETIKNSPCYLGWYLTKMMTICLFKEPNADMQLQAIYDEADLLATSEEDYKTLEKMGKVMRNECYYMASM